MSDSSAQDTRPQSDVGHLAVDLLDRGPDLRFAFERTDRRMGGAFGASVLAHGAMFLIAVLVARYAPIPNAATVFAERLNKDIVWLDMPGPGGGGGGGGNKMPEPPRKAELPGRDKIAVPVVKPPELGKPKQEPKEEPKPEQQLVIPAQTLASGTQMLAGAIEGAIGSNVSQGMGTGGGAGTGTGTGIGPGQGSGLGPGWGGGTGGGPYRPGNGVESPRLRREVKPMYTADAMRAKVQGTALLEAIVMPDGTVGNVRVLRSLDSVFGLDQEAIKAAKQWLFMPGTKNGQPVPVLVTIEISFTLR